MFRLGRISRLIAIALFFLVFTPFLPPSVRAQGPELPKEIRGYKLHRAKIHLSPGTKAKRSEDADARIKFGEPKLTDASLSGISLEVSVEASPLTASGTINFFTFDGFRVNGVPIEIEEFKGPVSFTKDMPFLLPRPIKLFVTRGGILQAAWNEFKNEQNEWLVTGRVFVFGKFRKMGFNFRRVIPVDVRIMIKNPLPRLK